MNYICREARDYLRTYRAMEAGVDSRLEHLRRLRARLLPGAQKLSDLPRGGQQLDWTELSVQCMELEKDLENEVRLMRARQQEIRNAIGLLQNEKWQSVLSYRYISGYDWNTIAEKMGLDGQYIFNLHAEALRRIRVPIRDT